MHTGQSQSPRRPIHWGICGAGKISTDFAIGLFQNGFLFKVSSDMFSSHKGCISSMKWHIFSLSVLNRNVRAGEGPGVVQSQHQLRFLSPCSRFSRRKWSKGVCPEICCFWAEHRPQLPGWRSTAFLVKRCMDRCTYERRLLFGEMESTGEYPGLPKTS